MQFMDDAIWTLLQQGVVSPHEAFMKAIDKNRFKQFLPEDEEAWPTPPAPRPMTKSACRGTSLKARSRRDDNRERLLPDN